MANIYVLLLKWSLSILVIKRPFKTTAMRKLLNFLNFFVVLLVQFSSTEWIIKFCISCNPLTILKRFLTPKFSHFFKWNMFTKWNGFHIFHFSKRNRFIKIIDCWFIEPNRMVRNCILRIVKFLCSSSLANANRLLGVLNRWLGLSNWIIRYILHTMNLMVPNVFHTV